MTLRKKSTFYAEIRRNDDKEYFTVLIDRDGVDAFKGEAKIRKHHVVSQLTTWFPFIEVIDRTK